jgi:hypothetical protein
MPYSGHNGAGARARVHRDQHHLPDSGRFFLPVRAGCSHTIPASR